MTETFHFAGFELDERTRSLAREGREVVLQPRVFDLLVYLVRHRDRVVSKDELIDAVWGGAFVADGAVQRAVSLARSALREGAPDALRTHPRQGYRFCAPLDGPSPATGRAPADSAEAGVDPALRAFEQEEWAEAARLYRAADGERGLEGAALERWGQAAEYQGKLAEATRPLERAVAAHAAARDPRAAARAAIRLGNLRLELRETAVAAGWSRRAARYLERVELGREHGLLAWLRARLALFGGRTGEALAEAERVLEIGRQLEDGDLEATGLNYTGLALVALGETDRGLARLDEAAAMVLAGEVGPWEGGMVFCGVLWGCLNAGDWTRASQWADQFSRWCTAHSVSGFPGLCRLHRAEVLALQGELEAAEREVVRVQQTCLEAIPWAEGESHRLLGDIQLARGDLDAAERSFRRAHELGWEPYPGLALLQVARGNADAALRSLESVLETPSWVNSQKRGILLAHLVVVAAGAGREERARAALAELEADPCLTATVGAQAMAARARGELALAEGRPREAASCLRESIRRWIEVPCPTQVAGARVRLAQALAAEGDRAGAELELAAAEALLCEAGPSPLLEECRQLRATLLPPA